MKSKEYCNLSIQIKTMHNAIQGVHKFLATFEQVFVDRIGEDYACFISHLTADIVNVFFDYLLVTLL